MHREIRRSGSYLFCATLLGASLWLADFARGNALLPLGTSTGGTAMNSTVWNYAKATDNWNFPTDAGAGSFIYSPSVSGGASQSGGTATLVLTTSSGTPPNNRGTEIFSNVDINGSTTGSMSFTLTGGGNNYYGIKFDATVQSANLPHGIVSSFFLYTTNNSNAANETDFEVYKTSSDAINGTATILLSNWRNWPGGNVTQDGKTHWSYATSAANSFISSPETFSVRWFQDHTEWWINNSLAYSSNRAVADPGNYMTIRLNYWTPGSGWNDPYNANLNVQYPNSTFNYNATGISATQLSSSSYAISTTGTNAAIFDTGSPQVLTNSVTGSGSISVVGTSILTLSGSNTYTGTTTLNSGALRLGSSASLPGGVGLAGGLSNLVFAGGVLELASGNFSRGLGTLASQVQFSNSGGFSAVGANRTVNLGGSKATLSWGSGNFVPSGSALLLGSAGDTATIDFQNPINLGALSRTIQVVHGSAVADAKLSGSISGSGGLIKTGNGRLVLSNSNTFTGGLVIGGGSIELDSRNALANGIGLNVSAGAALILEGPTAPVTGPTADETAPPNAVPEPSTLALLIVGATVILFAPRNAKR